MLRTSSAFKTSALALVISAQLVLSACGGESVSAFEAASQAAPAAPAAAAPAPQPVAAAPAPVQQVCNTCGVVTSINMVSSQGQTSGVGAAVGALVGGLVGNQVGGGSGKRVATVAGVVGGALAGNTIEQRRNSNQEMEVVINMDNGGERRVRVFDTGPLSVGSRVTVDGNNNINLR
jgi:outer membrane lipoprotein SlyB